MAAADPGPATTAAVPAESGPVAVEPVAVQQAAPVSLRRLALAKQYAAKARSKVSGSTAATGRLFRRAPRAVLTATALVALLVLASATAVDSQGNSGTIKVHDEADADPDQRNEPHVDCEDFWVEGFNMAEDSGDWFIFSWPPTGDKTLVMEGEWAADGADPEHHFLLGPLTLEPGHYRVGASNGPAEAEDFPGGMKKKTFWVEECPPETPPGEEEPPEEEPLPCPPGLLAIANDDGSVTLTWTDAEGSDGTNVYRADGDGDFEYLATVAPGVQSYTDDTTVVGESYTYMVTALFGNEESEVCDQVEVTAIPELPTVMAAGLAVGGGALAFVFAARRRRDG